MKKNLKLSMWWLFLHAPLFAEDAIPLSIVYQGEMVNVPELVWEDGDYEIRFEVFDSLVGGVLIWGESREVAVESGIFSVALGGVGSTLVAQSKVQNIASAFAGGERYMQTTIVSGANVASESVFTPRQMLSSAPYVIEAFNGVPPGTVMPFFGEQAPPGWLLCDGHAYLKTGKFQRLFLAIGTSCGSPDSDKFNVPDLRGRFLRSIDNMGTEEGVAGRDPGAAGRNAMKPGGSTGSDIMAIGSIQGGATSMPINALVTGLPKYVADPTNLTGKHDHATHGSGEISNGYSFLTISNSTFGAGGGSAANFGGRSTVDNSMRTGDGGNHTHPITEGDGETRPINAACNFIIKY